MVKQVSRVGARRGDRSERELVSTYFDANKHKLKRNGLTLRVRQTDDGYVQTVKTAARRASRREGWLPRSYNWGSRPSRSRQ
jgi:triphosphatase